MVHQLPIRPRFGELDPYNHVNHSVYVSWFEAARCEALESIGLALHSLAERGLQIVVVDLAVKYRKPARAGDDLVVETAVTEIGGVSSTWSQRLVRLRSSTKQQAPDPLAPPVEPGPELLCEATVRAGICDLQGRPTRAGAKIREELMPLFVGAEKWHDQGDIA